MADSADRVAPKTGCNLEVMKNENGRGKESAPLEVAAAAVAAAAGGGATGGAAAILKGSDTSKKKEARDNPFDQYYAQLIHQQNMLQDSVRVAAYQSAICENASDFKVKMRP